MTGQQRQLVRLGALVAGSVALLAVLLRILAGPATPPDLIVTESQARQLRAEQACLDDSNVYVLTPNGGTCLDPGNLGRIVLGYHPKGVAP